MASPCAWTQSFTLARCLSWCSSDSVCGCAAAKNIGALEEDITVDCRLRLFWAKAGRCEPLRRFDVWSAYRQIKADSSGRNRRMAPAKGTRPRRHSQFSEV